MHHHIHFYMGAGDRAPILLLVDQTLQQLNYLPTPRATFLLPE